MDLENLRGLAREAAKSDFLWELGMRARSATHARNICKDLAVPLADEKRVKAVMRLREDNPEAPLEIRDDAADERGGSKMEVKRGKTFFYTCTQPLLRRLAVNLITADVKSDGRTEPNAREVLALEGLGERKCRVCFSDKLRVLEERETWNGGRSIIIEIEAVENGNPRMESTAVADDGLQDLIIRVKDKMAMKAVRNFGRVWEAKSKQLKDSREAKVTIYQDFA